MSTMTLKADARAKEAPKSELRMMREQGQIPAVVYGKQVNSTPIVVDEKQLLELLRSNPNAIIQLDIPGQGTHPVMVTDIHRDSLKRTMLHIDFHQINMNEPVRAMVTLEYAGEPDAVREGGVLTPVAHEIEVRCLPQHLPEIIVVDVSTMELGESMLAHQLQMPPHVELKTDGNAVLVSILVPQKAAEDVEPVEGPSAEETKERSEAQEAGQTT